jgi:hypothetical protein
LSYKYLLLFLARGGHLGFLQFLPGGSDALEDDERDAHAEEEYVQGTSALRAIAVYRFAQGETARMIDEDLEGITPIRAPVDFSELRLACQAEIALTGAAAARTDDARAAVPESPADIPPRLFCDADLARISRISSSVDCECPQHLAGLLSSLTAFEQYSVECEDRTPEDAAIHAALHRSTAQARSTMERALRDLMVAEGLDLS